MSGKRSATANPGCRFPVLYDGWPLVHAPGRPAALHLLEILSALPKGVEPWVALPFNGDRNQTQQLFGTIRCVFDDNDGVEGVEEVESAVYPLSAPEPDTPGGRLRWQQWMIPAQARKIGAKLVHTTGASPPLFSSVPVILSPTGDFTAASSTTFAGRLGDALGRGGITGAQAVLWPSDLPDPPGRFPLRRMPPYVHPAFFKPQPRPEALPENYILAAGLLDDRALDLLAAAWSWAQDGLGEDWALATCDLDEPGLDRLRSMCQEVGFTGTIERVTATTPEQRAACFQHAGALLSFGPAVPWADPLLQALACGRPLIAEESAQADARTGPAAYLIPRGDARAMGAALITVIVEEMVGEQLNQAARKRSNAWNALAFTRGLAEAYGIKSEGERA